MGGNIRRFVFISLLISCLAGAAFAQTAPTEYQPIVGQEGKDVVWVPSPQAMVEKMLDLAKVTPQDFVIDLGSGDGRNVIAAAKRGARALGVEFNEKMVELSKRTAAREGVAERAMFVQGDMYEADISQATVLALFLMPDNLNKLLPKFLALPAGTRIVATYYSIKDWKPDVVEQAEKECEPWCTARLYIVPAKVAGTWRLDDGELRLEQQFQEISGTYVSGGTETPVKGRVSGEHITLAVGDTEYSGRVSGDNMAGEAWRAARAAR